jgi:excinuclease UvrABC nuclease subunit
VRDEIERIANRHLRRGRADARFRSALRRVASVQERDAIETAFLEVLELSELAHYYAGLAAGLTLAELGRSTR